MGGKKTILPSFAFFALALQRQGGTYARSLAHTHACTHVINSHLHGHEKQLVLRRSADVNPRASGAVQKKKTAHLVRRGGRQNK